MRTFTVTKYDLDTGRITGTIYGDLRDFLASVDRDRENIVEGEWGADTHYVLDGDPTDRPSIGAPVEATISIGETIRFEDLPAGTRVLIGGAEQMGLPGEAVIDDGVLDYSADVPGEVWFVFEPPFPYQHVRCHVTVSAQ